MEEQIKIEEQKIEHHLTSPPPPPAPEMSKIQENFVEDQNFSSEKPDTPVTEEPQNNVQSPGKFIGIIGGVVVFLILLIIFGVVGFFFFRGGDMDRVEKVTDTEPMRVIDEDVSANSHDRSAVCQDLIDNGIMGTKMTESDMEDLQGEVNNVLQSGGYNMQLTVEESCLVGVISADIINTQGTFEDTKTAKNRYDIQYGMTQKSVERSMAAAEIFLQNMAGDTRVASIKSAVLSTVPGMILCMDDNGYLTEPKEGQEMCRGNVAYGVWPMLSDKGAKWGGCEMSVERVNGVIEHFAYCVTMADGTIVMCREDGCNFDDEIR